MKSTDGQMDLMSASLPKYKIDKPIRLIELFGGIGAQAEALELLGANFERYKLSECKESYCLPQILIMENVPQVISESSKDAWNKWADSLEMLGYTNYIRVLNAKDFGIPQNRERCFCVSILGDFAYNFPLFVRQKYCLKDLEDKKIDKKYYLTKKGLDGIVNTTYQQNRLKNKLPAADNVSRTLCARDGSGPLLKLNKLFQMEGKFDSANRIYSEEIAPTLTTGSGGNREAKVGIPILNATKQGYDIAKDRDDIYISHLKGKRGTVQHGKTPTFKTSCDTGTVMCLNASVNGKEPHYQDRIYDARGVSPTIPASKGFMPYYGFNAVFAECLNLNFHADEKELNDTLRLSLTNLDETYVIDTKENIGLVIAQGTVFIVRKFTPNEYLKLMGFPIGTYASVKNAGLSNSDCYHLAGDSIVVQCLIGIFGELTGLDYQKVINDTITKLCRKEI